LTLREEGAGHNPQAFELESLRGAPRDDRDRGPHPHDLLDRPRGERGSVGESRPLGRVRQEGGQRTAELVASGVLAGEHQPCHQDAQLRVAQLVTGFFHGDEGRDQVGSGGGASLGEQVVDAGGQAQERRLDPGAVLGHGVAEEEAQIGGPAVELRVVLARDAEQRAIMRDG
jgi:hypothetical protein